MKTITLHLTFSAAVLEILCSLSRLEEKDYQTSNTHRLKTEGEAREGLRDAREGCPLHWEDENGPLPETETAGGETRPQGENHVGTGVPPPWETAMVSLGMISIVTATIKILD